MNTHAFRPLRPLVALLLAAGMGLAVWQLSRARFSTSVFDLLPLSDPVIRQQHHLLDLFGLYDRTFIEVRRVSGTGNDLVAAGQKVRTLLARSSLLHLDTMLAPGDIVPLSRYLVRHWPLLCSPRDSAWVGARIQTDSLAARLTHNLQSLFVFSDQGMDPTLVLADPFGFGRRALRRLAAFQPRKDLTIFEGFISDTSHSRLLLTGAQAANSSPDPETIVALMDSAASLATTHGCTLDWISAARAAHDNEQQVRRDAHLTAPLTLTAIFLLFVLVYRRMLFGILVFFPTLIGILFALALISISESLSIIMIGFGAGLVGITIDYSVHFLYHLQIDPIDKNPARTLRPAILASAGTTAGAFGVLVLAGLPGLTQLGTVTATGILFVALLSIQVLPLFFSRPVTISRQAPLDLPRIWENIFAQVWFSRLAPVAIIVVLLCLPGLWLLSFDGSPKRLNGMRPATRAAEARIAGNWGGVHGSTLLVIKDSSLAGLQRTLHMHVTPLLDSLRLANLVQAPVPFSTLLLPRSVQDECFRRYKALHTREVIDRMQQVIDSVAPVFGVSPQMFAPARDSLTVRPTPIIRKALPHGFRNGLLANYLQQDSTGNWYGAVPLSILVPEKRDTIDALLRSRGYITVNEDVLGRRLVTLIREGFLRCALWIPLIVVLVLLVALRSPRLILIALTPVAAALVTSLGCMGYWGHPINIVSMMVFAFVCGLGIDYALLLVHSQCHHHRPGSLARAAASVTVAALTSLAGLGFLAFAGHPVLATLGKVGLLGIGTSLFFAVVLVPAGLALGRIKKRG